MIAGDAGPQSALPGPVRIPFDAAALAAAAACVLVARAASRVHGLGPSEEMEIAYRGDLLAD